MGGAPVAMEAKAVDEETVAGPEHYATGYPTQDKDGAIHAVVEIPAGTVAKFEVDDADGRLKWEHGKRDGLPRAVDYLPYPVNYGMIPRTLAEDGDALDVIVLGRGIERGHVAKTRVIGVVLMVQDDGARDDKLIAVPLDKPWQNGFSRLRDLPELEEHYPAVREILELWFENYWGPGATNVVGFGNAEEAMDILEAAKREAMACSTPRGASGPRPRAPLPSGVLAHSRPLLDPPRARD